MSKVLIIEDEKAMSDLIAIKFKVEGFEVDQAFNIAEAKTKLAAGGYDAVLSDYLLPDGNALDLIAEVRSKPEGANVPIIMATNYIEDLSQDKARELKIAEVIVKYQVVPAQMVQKIKALISPSATQSAPQPGQPAAQSTDNSLPTTATPAVASSPSAVSQTIAPPTDPTQGALPPGAIPPAPAPAQALAEPIPAPITPDPNKTS